MKRKPNLFTHESRRRPRVIIAGAIVLSLFAGWTMLEEANPSAAGADLSLQTVQSVQSGKKSSGGERRWRNSRAAEFAVAPKEISI